MGIEKQAVQKDASNTAVSWTGGKDCNLALLKAWRNPALRVTCLVVFCPEEARFRAHPLQVMELQAKSLSLPLRCIKFPKGCTDFKKAYIDGIRSLKIENGINVIATGDMDLVGTMKRNWIEECAECVSVRAYLPLWKADRGTVLRELIEEGFYVLFSCVKTPYFDASWIGRVLDKRTVSDLRELGRMEYRNVKPLDIGGENGEYHTMCLDGPLYQSKIRVQFLEPIELTGERSQSEGERWWVINSVVGRKSQKDADSREDSM